eukprot:10033483-Prorocentrum_lima.AAC.1
MILQRTFDYPTQDGEAQALRKLCYQGLRELNKDRMMKALAQAHYHKQGKEWRKRVLTKGLL